MLLSKALIYEADGVEIYRRGDESRGQQTAERSPSEQREMQSTYINTQACLGARAFVSPSVQLF